MSNQYPRFLRQETGYALLEQFFTHVSVYSRQRIVEQIDIGVSVHCSVDDT